jgi:hypothetical protein
MGFTARGTVDGRFEVKFGGVTAYVGTTSIAEPDYKLVLPNPDPAAAGSLVTIVATNNSLTDIGDFECTLLGFEMPTGATVETPDNANNTYGLTTALAVNATATIVSFVAGPGYKFKGFVARGTADGRYFVTFNGVTVYALGSDIAEPNVILTLPNPDASAGSTTVAIKVTNIGSVTGDYEATILGV